MTDLASPLLASFGTGHFNLGLQLGDLSNDDAIRRARDDSGSSISWIVGHLLDFRCSALAACGVEQDNPYREKFAFNVSATDGSDYPDIATLLQEWNDIHAKLTGAIAGLSEEQLLAKSGLPGPHGEQSLLEALSFFTFHEAYHIGAIGVLRVQWGYRHTHERAMEAMNMAPPQ